METAVLRLGLAGFTKPERDLIGEVAARFRRCYWTCGEPEGADAWLLNGARIARVQSPHVRVICADGARQGMPIVLDSSSRPAAIALPTPAQVPSASTFHLRDPVTLVRILGNFDRQLHHRKVCYWTAAHLIEHNATVGKALYELRSGGELLAVADMKGEVAVSPIATESSFDSAVWKHRARKTVTVPATFARHSLEQLMWEYTLRTRREDLLPKRYRECAIFLRRSPRIEANLIDDDQLKIMRELALGPMSFDELRATLQLEGRVLARALAALYYVGSITSNPERASHVSGRGGLWAVRASATDRAPLNAASRQAGSDTRPSTTPLL